MASAKKVARVLRLNEPEFLPTRLQLSCTHSARINRWPWSMAILSIRHLKMAAGVAELKDVDAVECLVEIDQRIRAWEWDSTTTVTNPLTAVTFPNSIVGRAKQKLGNAVLAMTDDEVGEVCEHVDSWSNPAAVGDRLNGTIHAITNGRYCRLSAPVVDILRGGCGWFASVANAACWQTPFELWPDSVGPSGVFQECRLFMFRRHCTGRDPRFESCWGEPCDLPAIAIDSADAKVVLSAWRARLVYGLLTTYHEQFGSTLRDVWREAVPGCSMPNRVGEFLASPSRQRASDAVIFLNENHKTLDTRLSGEEVGKSATGKALTKPPTARKRGRRKGSSRHDLQKDQRLSEAWKSGLYASKTGVDDENKEPHGTTHAAHDRHRKRVAAARKKEHGKNVSSD